MTRSTIYIDANMFELRGTADVLATLLRESNFDASATELCIVSDETVGVVYRKIACMISAPSPLLNFKTLKIAKWDSLPTADTEQSIFFSLDPERNRLAKHREWQTITESYGHINAADEEAAIGKITTALSAEPLTPVLIALDFDETIAVNQHPHKTRGLAVINHHVVNFFVKLITRMKAELGDHFRDRFDRLLSTEIVTTRHTDEVIETEFQKLYPNHDNIYMKQALPVFLEEVQRRTGETITIKNKHFLRRTVYENNKAGFVHTVMLGQQTQPTFCLMIDDLEFSIESFRSAGNTESHYGLKIHSPNYGVRHIVYNEKIVAVYTATTNATPLPTPEEWQPAHPFIPPVSPHHPNPDGQSTSSCIPAVQSATFNNTGGADSRASSCTMPRFFADQKQMHARSRYDTEGSSTEDSSDDGFNWKPFLPSGATTKPPQPNYRAPRR